MTDYVAYFRVSTMRQGRSGLGLAAQQSKVRDFIGSDGAIIAEFIEVQSGRTDTREQLWKAINHAKKHAAKIVIAKLDRFSRRVSFIAHIMEQGVGLVVAEMPNASDFQLHIFAALAQEERRLISDRTRAALAEAKRRGTRLGINAQRLRIIHREQADAFSRSISPIVLPLLGEGLSYSAIARRLNDDGVATANGGRFHAQTIKNVLARLSPAENSNAR